MVDDTPLEVLDESTCWELLRSVPVGRLAIPIDDGRVEIFPVNHLVDQGSIVFRTAPGTKISEIAPPERPGEEPADRTCRVAFEVDDAAAVAAGDEVMAWSVVVQGTASLLTTTTDLFDSFDLDVRPWHLASKPFFVRIVPETVTGRRFRVRRNAASDADTNG